MGLGLCRWAYRLRQGLVRLVVALRPSLLDETPARAHLSPQGWELFRRMAPGDRAHGLCVLASLRERGEPPAWLAEAALLHDVGKLGSGLTLAHRAAIVLLGPLAARLGSRPGSGWRRPFYAQRKHADRGAELCAQAGCDPRCVALVRWHESPTASLPDASLREALAALQAADDRC